MSTALDLPSLAPEAPGSDSFAWPVAYGRYLTLVAELRNGIRKAGRNLCDGAADRDIFESAIAGLLADTERPARLALEMSACAEHSLSARFDPEWSPLTALLAAESDPGDADVEVGRVFPRPFNAPATSGLRRIAGQMATAWRMMTVVAPTRLDFHNRSPLLDDFLARNAASVVLVRPERWPTRGNAAAKREAELGQAIGDVAATALRDAGCSQFLALRAAQMARVHATSRLARVRSLFETQRASWFGRHIGPTLVGGTPKEIGRLLNRHYRSRGSEVWRFSHGGDRAFFKDPIWPMTELCGVSRYYVHGVAEARNMQRRYAGDPLVGGVAFHSEGSDRHRKWWDEGESRRKTRAARPSGKRKVILFSGAFLGEAVMGHVDFRQPDPLALDTQFHLARVLSRHGYDVHIKPHPGGLKTVRSLYDPLGMPLVPGRFEVCRMDADCYIFEFAGSAFFDALASEIGIVLVDTGVRVWDAEGKQDLSKRCEIVETRLDSRNRMRADESLLLEAVERACERRGCSKEFAQGYFSN